MWTYSGRWNLIGRLIILKSDLTCSFGCTGCFLIFKYESFSSYLTGLSPELWLVPLLSCDWLWLFGNTQETVQVRRDQWATLHGQKYVDVWTQHRVSAVCSRASSHNSTGEVRHDAGDQVRPGLSPGPSADLFRPPQPTISSSAPWMSSYCF